MNDKISAKDVIILLIPLLLFYFLLPPYAFFHHEFVRGWLGFGRRIIFDEYVLRESFSASDFAELFWKFISFCSSALSMFTVKHIEKGRGWLKLLYVAVTILLSICLGKLFTSFFISHVMI